MLKGLWLFISYCEAYYDDCYLVKRCHFNLLILVETFMNIINVSVKDRVKSSFKQQRLSMLPNVAGSGITKTESDAGTNNACE